VTDEERDSDGVDALFVVDGPRLVPTGYTRGPWSPESLHGGPVAAAVVRATERTAATDDRLRMTRLTLELLRPVGLAPFTVTASVVRPGRKVQVVDAVVEQSGVQGYRAFHNAGVEIRYVAGHLDRPGPATAWFRLRVPVVAGEEPSPGQRAVAVADFGNGISSELDMTTSVFVNPDLTVHLLRPPAGEWIALDARTRFGPPGTGLAESALWDESGRIGRALQSLYVESER